VLPCGPASQASRNTALPPPAWAISLRFVARPRIPQRFLDVRWLPVYVAVLAGLAWARPEPGPLAAGVVLATAGAALRVWSLGHLVKTRRLTLGGPYAYLRHPLYAGTLLIGLGFLFAIGGPVAPWAGAVLVPLFFLYYLPYKDRIESARLERRYGDLYRAYHDAVPALLPRGRRWPPGEPDRPAFDPSRWSARRFRASSEGWMLLGLGAALGSLVARVA
jgi:protein-S-isoprenylcysteine O-methyltransferase Ste14